MTDKERLLRKIQFKERSGFDISAELSEAISMAYDEVDADKHLTDTMVELDERFSRDMENLPATTSLIGKISVKLDNMKTSFDDFLKSYKSGCTEDWKNDVDYLNVLGFNIVGDSVSLVPGCDLTDKLEKLSGLNLDRENADIETFIKLFPEYLKNCSDELGDGGESLYLAINNLMYLTDYGCEAAYNAMDNI